jgi:RNA polymerase sigma-70 factor (ECF subfamily)
VSTWLVSITRNRAIDELRRGKIRPEQHSVGWDEVEPEKIFNSDDPEEIAELTWEKSVVQRAISDLPELQRKALALAYFRGYTHSEIAEALGEPLGTVKTRIRLAMQKLYQVLSEQGMIEG